MRSDNPSRPDNACAKCGACTSVCPVYLATGQESLTARGRLHLLGKIAGNKQTSAYHDIFSKCLLCGACRQACPRGIDLPALVVESRHRFPAESGQGRLARKLVGKCLPNPRIMTGFSKILRISAPLFAKLPADSGLRLKLDLPASYGSGTRSTEPIPGAFSAGDFAATMIFTGCFARHLDPAITSATVELVSRKEKGPPRLPGSQSCCGLAFYSRGDLEEARHLARLNITAFAGSDAPIIVLCGSCFSHLADYPALLAGDNEWHPRALAFADRLRELSVFLNNPEILPVNQQNGQAGAVKKRAIYHDPCHLRHLPAFTEPPRELLNKLPWLELTDSSDFHNCCGFGGLFNLAHPDISRDIARKAVEDIRAAAPDLVITTCTGCLIQLRRHLHRAKTRIRVLHLAQVLNGKID
jgi:glycolate oxidase iron-sulfur subunit